MIKTKYLFFISIMLLTACGATQEINEGSTGDKGEHSIEEIVIHGNYIKYEDEPDLNKDADLIIIGSTSERFEDREHIATYTPAEENLPETLESFHTVTPIIVEEILKADENISIQAGSELDVIEPVAIIEENGVYKKLSIENYMELKEDTNYIIYLGENTYGEYSVINMNNGRFNLESEDQIVNLNEHNHDNDKEEHEAFKKDVFERYAEELKDY